MEEEGRRNLDSPQRYALRRRWSPDREHRGGVGGGDLDFMSDELLYRPGRLGEAAVEPARVTAGSNGPAFVVTYMAGEEGVEQGGEVSLVCRGIAPLGAAFQVRDAARPCFVRFTAPEHCGIEPFDPDDWRATFPLGFRIERGRLRTGDVVRMEVRPGDGFTWTRIAGRKEIKVCVKPRPGGPEFRLPEPLVITVEPGPAERLEVILPGTRLPGQAVQAVITTRDRSDNRAPVDAVVCIADMESTRVCSGFGIARVTDPATPLRVSARTVPAGLAAVSNPCVASRDLQLFFGDLHAHDLLSEAEGRPEEVYGWARDDRRYDFVAVSPQSHGWHDNETWTLTKYMTERFHDPGRFITFLSYEWQHSGYGDKIVHYLGGDQPCLYADDPRSDTPRKLCEALRDSDAFVISHHPAYPQGSWVAGTDYATVDTDVERLIELWSMHGSSEGHMPGDRPLKAMDDGNTVMAALRRGLRVGFVAGSDTHKGRPGGSPEGQNPPNWGGMAGVWAPALTRRSLYEAFRARRTYALTGARIVLRMTVNGAWMGAEIPFAGDVCVRIDCWAPEPIRRVELLRDTRLLREFPGDRDECHLEHGDRIAEPAFYHCRVTLDGGDLAVSSPVWVG